MNRVRKLIRAADPGFLAHLGRRGLSSVRQVFREYRQWSSLGADPTTAMVAKRDRIDVGSLQAISVGEGTSFGPGARLLAWPSAAGMALGRVEVGRSVRIARRFFAEAYTGQVMRVGDFATIGEHCVFIGDVTIGAHCLVSWHVFASSGNHHVRTRPTWLIHDQDALALADPSWSSRDSRAVVVDEDCWLGWGTFLKDGVHVGRGAIIGAQSVVTKNVPPYTIVAGNPARPIGIRLVFAPPMSLDPRDDAHLPYFYQGFATRRADLDTRAGGIAAGECARLVLAGGPVRGVTLTGVWLARQPGMRVEVEVNGLPSGNVACTGDTFEATFAASENNGSTVPKLLSPYTVVDLRTRGAAREVSTYAITSAQVLAN